MLYIGGHTIRPIVLKFGMEDHIYPWEVIGYILLWYPNPLGQGRPKSASGGPYSPNRAFLRKLYKTKVAERPWSSVEK